MPTSPRSDFRDWTPGERSSSRTAVYGPVRTVVWEGRGREAPPYPDCRARTPGSGLKFTTSEPAGRICRLLSRLDCGSVRAGSRGGEHAGERARKETGMRNEEGNPAFGINFYIIDAKGEYAGV